MLPKPVCVKLPADLDALLRDRANREGVSVSEMLRAIVSQWIYGTVPSVDEGYIAGRQLAVKVAHEALMRVFADFVPSSYESAREALHQLEEAKKR